MRQLQFKYMSKLFLVMSFILLARCNIVPGWPDAIRCGGDNTCCDASTLILHGGNKHSVYHYRQAFSGQDRGVGFHPNGSYAYGVGNYDIRRGCEFKSIADLKKQGRAYNMDNSQLSQQIKQLNQRLNNSEEQILRINSKKQLSLMDLQQTKQKWKNQVKKQLLEDIKKNGLALCSKWKITQETTWNLSNDFKEQKDKNLKNDDYLTSNRKDSN